MIQSGENSNMSLWRSNAADCEWANYGNNYVVYHRPSGKTHFLNAAGYRLLTEILTSACQTATIAAKLAENNAGELGTLKAEDVHDMLIRFEYLGLVDRSVPQP
jgi:PqqD family protein of HPr-rel-A system